MDPETVTTTVPPSKRQKFVELANRRVNNALKAISLIGTLSNRNAYEYSKEDLAKIFKALDEAIDSVRQRFETKKPEQGGGFRL
jgi:bifunctional pyridoxal-dependent enzyme with beta-cystathionase and maltose regulon repressor activities